VQLVDEQDDVALTLRDFFEHRFEPVFKLAAVLCACNERTEIERNDAFVLEALGNVAAHDTMREALNDRRLANAGFADEHRVVFRAPREHLDDPPDLFIAPDDGINLVLPRQRGQVATVSLQRLVFAFGGLICDALAAANGAERFEKALSRCVNFLEQRRRFRFTARFGDGQQQVFS
jgi:hypothetical protein